MPDSSAPSAFEAKVSRSGRAGCKPDGQCRCAPQGQHVHGCHGLFGEKLPNPHEQVAFGKVLVHRRKQVSVLPRELLAGWHEQYHRGLLGVGLQAAEFAGGRPKQLRSVLGVSNGVMTVRDSAEACV